MDMISVPKFLEYAPCPCQVVFCSDSECDDAVHAGIYIGDYVICGCCGGLVSMEEITAIKCLPWVNIEEEIGGCLDDDERGW